MQYADQLCLGCRGKLEMKTAQCTSSARSRLIFLNEGADDAEITQALVMKGFAEPSAIVGMALGYDGKRQEH